MFKFLKNLFKNPDCYCVGKNCGAGGPPGQKSYAICESALRNVRSLPRPIPDPPERK